MHLSVHPGRSAILSNEKRRIVVLGGRSPDNLIAAEENRYMGLACDRADRLRAGRVLLEEKRRGRLGPDDEHGSLGNRIPGHLDIGPEDRRASLRVELL